MQKRSTISDFQGASSSIRRRSSAITTREPRPCRPDDVPHVKKLVDVQTRKQFGDVDVDALTCNSCYSAVLEDDCEGVIAAVFAANYPNVPSLPAWSWESWIRNIYAMDGVTSRNSLWVHLAVFERRYTYTFLPAVLHQIFESTYVKFVLFVTPPRCTNIEWLEARAAQVAPASSSAGRSDPRNVQTLHVCLRQDYTSRYKIRRAVVEDNDDIVPLVDGHSMLLRETYGGYYIAELIASDEQGRQLFVAEKDGYAVAVMCLNGTVNYDVLANCFELEPFGGLKKPDPTDELVPSEFDRVTLDTVDIELSSMLLAPGKILANQAPPSDDAFSYDYLSVLSTKRAADGTILGALDTDASICRLTYTEGEVRSLKRRAENAAGTSKSSMDMARNIRNAQRAILGHHGEGNAFAIEIAAALPRHEDALLTLVEASFQCFPDQDYCVICAPTDEMFSKLFVRVPPRATSNFPHELYVVHRSALFEQVVLRPAFDCDVSDVERLLARVRNKDEVLRLFHCSLDAHASYVVTCQEQVVGLAIVSDQNDTEYIKSHYELNYLTDVAQHKHGCHGRLDHFVLSPIFQRHSKLLLLELHRLTDYSIIYYMVTRATFNSRSPVAANVLAEMNPVAPSKIPEYSKMADESWRLPEDVGRIEMPYALYVSTPQHCGLTRREVNTRIVMVGASDVGISFLNTLVFGNRPGRRRVTFNNVTLVSTHGLRRHGSNRFRDLLEPVTGDICGYTLALASLRTHVNVVRGVMSSIDRKRRMVTVDGAQLPYDLLLLTCGLQFQMPRRRDGARKADVECPKNVYVVNTDVDADDALMALKRDLQGIMVMHSNVIVYGNKIEAYCCLTALLKMGIPGPQLIFVIPKPKDDHLRKHVAVFEVEEVRRATHAVIEEEGVIVYEDHEFVDWSFDEEGGAVTSVRFDSAHNSVDVDCLAVFAYVDRTISRRTFLAVNGASLVFDGALVIEPDGRTNDPDIYAAGTMTKYPRRYHADHMKHKHFNRIEIGRRLAETIVQRLTGDDSPSERPGDRCTDPDKLLVPHYHKPLMLYCKLPGDLQFLHVRKPGQNVPVDIAELSDDHGRIITTGDPRDLNARGYFRLHLNRYNSVETITCLAKQEIETVNLTYLWGKHESLLNNLVTRYDLGLIDDLFAYFRQPWICAVYIDAYKKFDDETNEMLMSAVVENGDPVVEDLVGVFDKSRKLTAEQYEAIRAMFVGSEYNKALEEKFHDFLTDNLLYLPMYSHPIIVNMILGDYGESPLFKPM